MKLLKPNFWSKGKFNLYALALLPLSFFLQLIIFVKKKIVKPIKFNIKIICVGNIYHGDDFIRNYKVKNINHLTVASLI